MSQAAEPSPLCPAQQLTRSGLRKDDPLDQVLLPPLRKPVYILLQDHERAQRLAQQLEFFGLVVQALASAAAFQASISEYPPSAIIMDVDFNGAGQGLLLAAQMQQGWPDIYHCCSSAITKPTPRPAWPPCAPVARTSSPAPWKPPACWKRSNC